VFASPSLIFVGGYDFVVAQLLYLLVDIVSLEVLLIGALATLFYLQI